MENERKNGWSKILLGVVIALALVAVGAAGMYYYIKLVPGTTIINKSEKEVTVNENGISDAVEKVYDSVVIVQVYNNGRLYGTGSGFIFKNEGNKYYVMTNCHVITPAESVKIVLSDDSIIDTSIVGSDKYLDIGVIAFDSDKDIKVAEIGSSEKAKVGDTVFTVGAPIDSSVYSWTVTRGILSGKDRQVTVSTNSNSNVADYVRTALTTDAVINSGNSGGPLCNSNGQVIGITNMKLVSTGIEGMSFAIPIDDAISYANKLIKGEDTSRPSLGVYTAELYQAELAYYYYGIKVPSNVESGVIITKIVENSPAEKAGLKKGDVILEINGTKVGSMAELKTQLYKYGAGDKIKITYNRDGNVKETSAVLVKSSE